MNKKERKSKIEELNSDPYFQYVLNLLEDEEQKKKIKAYVEDAYVNMIQHGATIAMKIKQNPEMLAKVAAEGIPKDKEPTVIKDK